MNLNNSVLIGGIWLGTNILVSFLNEGKAILDFSTIFL